MMKATEGKARASDTSVTQPDAQSMDDGGAARGQSGEMLARAGVAGARQSLPHGAAIQASFGHHDISGVRTLTGGAAQAAATELNAHAFAIGDRVGFAEAPDLHTAAHEAAHVVQQRAGVQRKATTGGAGALERHADQVADAVVAGRSAQSLLDQAPAGAPPPVQLRSAPKATPPKAKAKAARAGLEINSKTHGKAALNRFVDAERMTELMQLIAGTGFPRSFFVGLGDAFKALGKANVDSAAVLDGTRIMRAALDQFMAASAGTAQDAQRRKRADMLMGKLLPEVRRIEAGATQVVARSHLSLERVMGPLHDFLAAQDGRAAGFDTVKAELAGTAKGARFASYCIGSYVVEKKTNPQIAQIKAKNPKAGARLEAIADKQLPLRLQYVEKGATATLFLVGESGLRATKAVASHTMTKPGQTSATARRRRMNALLKAWGDSQGQLPCGRLAIEFAGTPFKRQFKVTAWWAQCQDWLKANPTAGNALFIAGLVAMGLSGVGTMLASGALASTASVAGAGLALTVGAAGVTISGINLYARYKRGTLLSDWRGSMIDLISVLAGTAGIAAGAGTLAEDTLTWLAARAATHMHHVPVRLTEALRWMAPQVSRLHGVANVMAITLAPGAYLLALPDVFGNFLDALKAGKRGEALWQAFVGVAGGALTYMSFKGALASEGINRSLAAAMIGRPKQFKQLPPDVQAGVRTLAGPRAKSPRKQALDDRIAVADTLGTYADPQLARVLKAVKRALTTIKRSERTHYGAQAETAHATPLPNMVVDGINVAFLASRSAPRPYNMQSGNVRTPGKVQRGEDTTHAVTVMVDGVELGTISVTTQYRMAPNAEFNRQLSVGARPSCAVSTKDSTLNVRTYLSKLAGKGRHGLTPAGLDRLYGTAGSKALDAAVKMAGKVGVVGTTTGAPLTGPAAGANDPNAAQRGPQPAGRAPGEVFIVGQPSSAVEARFADHLAQRGLLISSVFAHLAKARLRLETAAVPSVNLLKPIQVMDLPGGAVTIEWLGALLDATFQTPGLPTASGKTYTPGLAYHAAAADPAALAKLEKDLRHRCALYMARAGVFDGPMTARHQQALARVITAFDPTSAYAQFKRGLALGVTQLHGWKMGGPAFTPKRFKP